MRIYTTSNYKLFKVQKGNRIVNPNHVKLLSKSIAEHNMLESNPIVVNGNYEVVDGQHRLRVAEENKLPIYYFIIHDASIEDTRRRNNTVWKWSTEDYIKSYINRGKLDYQILYDFMTKYGLSPSIAILLLTNGGDRILKNVLYDFRNGNFKVKTLAAGIAMADILRKIKPFLDKSVEKDREFVTAITKTLKVISIEKLLHKLSIHNKLIKRASGTRDYLHQLEGVINYKSRSETRLY